MYNVIQEFGMFFSSRCVVRSLNFSILVSMCVYIYIHLYGCHICIYGVNLENHLKSVFDISGMPKGFLIWLW